LSELLDLVFRWVHVIAGIMWVGNSLLFNWLDRSLVAGPSRATDTSLTAGQVWLLHSGGFYYVEKTLLPGQRLPVPLHWFKWQAYTTWLTGAALLVVVYYVGARAALADPTVSPLSHGRALVVAIAAIVGGFGVYEAMNRYVAPRDARAALILWLGTLVLLATSLIELLNGRAAFIHVGAMLGTIMAGNVFFTIVPSQRALVASVEAGQDDNAAELSARAKRVSIHNNYFTFPVILLMVSSHFPSIYGHPRGLTLLLILVAGGAGVRHILNSRFTWPAWKPALALTIVATIAAVHGIQRTGATPRDAVEPGANLPVTFADARHVIDQRCVTCHSMQPSDMSFGGPPFGVMLDTPERIASLVPRIRERAVVTRTMPPGNKTNMTDAERSLLARWIAQGAVVR
jgi:uncharacterized membrane protein